MLLGVLLLLAAPPGGVSSSLTVHKSVLLTAGGPKHITWRPRLLKANVEFGEYETKPQSGRAVSSNNNNFFTTANQIKNTRIITVNLENSTKDFRLPRKKFDTLSFSRDGNQSFIIQTSKGRLPKARAQGEAIPIDDAAIVLTLKLDGHLSNAADTAANNSKIALAANEVRAHINNSVISHAIKRQFRNTTDDPSSEMHLDKLETIPFGVDLRGTENPPTAEKVGITENEAFVTEPGLADFPQSIDDLAFDAFSYRVKLYSKRDNYKKIYTKLSPTYNLEEIYNPLWYFSDTDVPNEKKNYDYFYAVLINFLLEEIKNNKAAEGLSIKKADATYESDTKHINTVNANSDVIYKKRTKHEPVNSGTAVTTEVTDWLSLSGLSTAAEDSDGTDIDKTVDKAAITPMAQVGNGKAEHEEEDTPLLQVGILKENAQFSRSWNLQVAPGFILTVLCGCVYLKRND